MVGAINVHVYDADNKPVRGAEVSWKGKHKGKRKSLGRLKAFTTNQ
jgi:hypothetical protein